MPNTPSYKVRLKYREEIAAGTMAFHFEKPEGFMFKSGQHIEVILPQMGEAETRLNERHFSLVSAPHEKELVVATRMRDSAFKNTLKALPLESEVKIKGPLGSFFLHSDASRSAVFLAGGIGITPFMSMVRNATHQKLPRKIFLFYSNRRPEDAAFLNELRDLERTNLNFKFVPAVTQADKSENKWQGERGYITKEMIVKYVGDFSTPIFYIAGPPMMVQGLREMLNSAGIDDDNIKSEEFGGY